MQRYKEYTLENEYLKVVFLNLGATVKALYVKKESLDVNVVLGFKMNKSYYRDPNCLGKTVGRTCNRTEGASFTLNGEVYHLSKNNGENSIHGGFIGFDSKFFDAKVADSEITFTYVSPDMEEGYPGELTLKVIYRLEGNKLVNEYVATSTKDTIINITNHSYFNLNGYQSDILDHELMINADNYVTCNEVCLVDQVTPVDETFDFRTPKKIGKNINDDHIQLKYAYGYDQCYIFNDGKVQVSLYSDITKIRMNMYTDQIAMHIYTANYLPKALGGRFGAIALEPENIPNSINRPDFPSMVLFKDDTYRRTTTYEFKIEE